MGCDAHRAYAVLGAVLYAIRDRVGHEVAAHLAAQLPLLVRGLCYERWGPTATPIRLSRTQFLAGIERDALLKGTTEAEDAARAVFGLLWRELGRHDDACARRASRRLRRPVLTLGRLPLPLWPKAAHDSQMKKLLVLTAIAIVSFIILRSKTPGLAKKVCGNRSDTTATPPPRSEVAA